MPYKVISHVVLFMLIWSVLLQWKWFKIESSFVVTIIIYHRIAWSKENSDSDLACVSYYYTGLLSVLCVKCSVVADLWSWSWTIISFISTKNDTSYAIHHTLILCSNVIVIINPVNHDHDCDLWLSRATSQFREA